MVWGLEQERARVLPLEWSYLVLHILLSGGGKGAILASHCVGVAPYHLPVAGTACSP